MPWGPGKLARGRGTDQGLDSGAGATVHFPPPVSRARGPLPTEAHRHVHALERPRTESRSGPLSDPVFEVGIPALQQRLADGSVTSLGLVEAYLARVNAYDHAGPALHALVALTADAPSRAAELDREREARGPRGPLHGIPVVIKDNMELAGLPTSNGSLALAAWPSERTAPLVRRLMGAGAIVLGKTNVHELASGISTIGSYGDQTRNPYDPGRNPGGSSGGTAAAVAASFAAVGWGSDTCGSIRIPAAHTNLVGLRPTLGRVDMTGVVPLCGSQDVAGPLARTVTDLAIALDHTLSAASRNTRTTCTDAIGSTDLAHVRLGLVPGRFDSAADGAEVEACVRHALSELEAAGASVVEVPLDALEELAERCSLIRWEFKFQFADYLAGIPGAPVGSLRELLSLGLHHRVLDRHFRDRDRPELPDSSEGREAKDAQARLREGLVAALDANGLDALVYPSIRRLPARIPDPQQGSNCQLAAHSGLPALCVPAGFSVDGLPVGLELLGPPHGDEALVGIGYAVEAVLARRRPPFFTPELSGGRAPGNPVGRIDAAAGGIRVAGTVELSGSDGSLAYDLAVEGLDPEKLVGMALSDTGSDPGDAGVVLHRLWPRGGERASGRVALTGHERALLVGGRCVVTVVTRSRPLTPIRVPLRLDGTTTA